MEKPRTVRTQALVPAPRQGVWDAWTTHGGVRGFFAPQANLDLRPGGAYELLFDPSEPPGLRGSEGCQVVTLIPPALLVFTWNFPTHLPIRGEHTRVTVELSESPGGTLVVLTQTGWRTGPGWDEGFAYFDRVWPVVLRRLVHRFTVGPVDWTNPPG